MMIKEKKYELKAQSTLEYSLIFACLVAACIAMKGYVQRSVQGGLRQSSDQIGEQYSPEKTDSDITVTFDSTTKIKSRIIQAIDPVTEIRLINRFGEPIYAMESETVNPVKETTERLGYEELGDFKAKLF